MNTNYKRGANAERELKKMLEADGAFVVRAAGSHGPFDVVAFRDGFIYGYQVKTGKAAFSENEREKMLRTGMAHGITPYIATRAKGGKWTIEVVH